MSTRCQVRIQTEGLSWKEERWLYHHWDGYPENMIPIINQAREVIFNNFTSKQRDPDTIKHYAYMNGRAGKVSSFLCTVDPVGFEPEDVGDLHGDIEYLYKLFLVNKGNGSFGSEPIWEMEVEHGYGEKMEPLFPRTRIWRKNGAFVPKDRNQQIGKNILNTLNLKGGFCPQKGENHVFVPTKKFGRSCSRIKGQSRNQWIKI